MSLAARNRNNRTSGLRLREGWLAGLFAALAVALAGTAGAATTTPTPILISQVPLTVSVAAHPQVLFALGNSESMDGDLSGAIMTGSGALDSSLSLLQSSSSPANYTVPDGFTAPVSGDGVGTSAPYTSSSGGKLYDNSASRLNVAKAAISSILTTFMPTTDFALLDYQTSGLKEYTTWVYYMSPSGGFTFSTSNASPPSGTSYVANPCYNTSSKASDPVSQDCQSLKQYYGSQVIKDQYMLIGTSSDDPSINDVLYSGGTDAVCVDYNGLYYYDSNGKGHALTSPYTYFSLANYEANQVNVGYASAVNSCAQDTTPTNAGFVPYSTEVMYVERGFGYGAGQSAASGNVLVSMQTAGTTPTPSSISTAIANFTPYLNPETNSTSTTEIKASAGQSPIAGLLTAANTYYANNTTTSNGCNPTQYVVLITDGLPTLDLNAKSWPPLGSAAASGYGVKASFNSDGSLNTSTSVTNDQALLDVITVLTKLQKAGIKTYVVGMGAGVDPSKNPSAASALTAMAIAGGTKSYFPATSAADLTNDLQVILSSILTASSSGTAPAVSSTSLNTSAAAYLASFDTQDSDGDWTGELMARKIDPTTAKVITTGNPLWSAQAQLDLQTTRLIATWDPVAAAGTPFEWTTDTKATTGIAPNTALGKALTGNTADTSGPHALQYLRGNRTLEVSGGGKYRNRTHVLGDIVDSGPLYIGAPLGASSDSTYVAFEKTYAQRPAMIYVGANDGMLHAFDASNGTELFAYIPNAVYANLIKLTYTYYNAQHQYFADGSPTANDVKFTDGTWHTVLASGERAGGTSVFALDVTDPKTIGFESDVASRVLWEFTDTNMGYSFSTPAIAKTAAGYMVFFGNGYNSSTQTPFLYALDPQKGTVQAKIDLCKAVTTACDSTKTNGLSSVVVANSTGSLAGNFDVLYAGDLQGNVWRVNIASSTASSWTATLLFQAQDGASTPQRQPITTAPAVTLNPKFPSPLGTMVYVGTGQMLAVADLSSTQTQSVYGLYDTGSRTTAILRRNLVKQTLSLSSATDANGNQLRTITSNAVSIPTNPGWYVDFSLLTGERVITDPRIDSGAVIAVTNDPGTSVCTGGDVAWLNEFNYATGGGFNTAQFDSGGSGSIGSSAANAAGMQLSDQAFASSPTVVSGSFGNQTRAKLIGVGTSVDTIVEKGPGQQRTAWWEKR